VASAGDPKTASPVAGHRTPAIAAGLLLLAIAVGVGAWWSTGARRAAPGKELAAISSPAGEEAALLAAAAERPGDPQPEVRLGEHYLAAGRPFAALWHYAEALQARPEDVPATLGLARALEAALLPQVAVERLRALLARHPDEPAARSQLVELLLRIGRPEEALVQLRPLLAVTSGAEADGSLTPGMAVLEGRVRQALGDRDGARAAYRRAVEDPSARDPAPWHRLGLLELERGDLFNARQAFGAARVLNGREPRYTVDYGRTYTLRPKPEEAMTALKYFVQAMNLSLSFAPAHVEAGRWYLEHRRWREAVERLRFAVDAAPGDTDAHEALAQALERIGQKAEAHRHRGIAYDLQDLRRLALQEFQSWTRLAPDDPEAELELSQAYFRINQRVEARARLEKARERFGKDRTIRERLIAMSLLLGDRAPVQTLIEEWLQEQPRAPRALWLQGRAAAEEQRYADAIRLYEQALNGDPENAEYLGAMGQALLSLPEKAALPRAVAAFARAAERAPDEKRWRLALAQALQRSGRAADARRQSLRALDLDPLLSEAYFLAARLATAEGARGAGALLADLVRRVEARLREETPLFEATWKRPGDARAYRTLADFLVRHGDLKAAAGQLAQAARLDPSAASRDRLARVQRLLAVQ
jgi:Flp pilus assembly protein TadD